MPAQVPLSTLPLGRIQFGLLHIAYEAFAKARDLRAPESGHAVDHVPTGIPARLLANLLIHGQDHFGMLPECTPEPSDPGPDLDRLAGIAAHAMAVMRRHYPEALTEVPIPPDDKSPEGPPPHVLLAGDFLAMHHAGACIVTDRPAGDMSAAADRFRRTWQDVQRAEGRPVP